MTTAIICHGVCLRPIILRRSGWKPKLAYAAIAETMMQSPLYDKNGVAYVKIDNPEIIHNLKKICEQRCRQTKNQPLL